MAVENKPKLSDEALKSLENLTELWEDGQEVSLNTDIGLAIDLQIYNSQLNLLNGSLAANSANLRKKTGNEIYADVIEGSLHVTDSGLRSKIRAIKERQESELIPELRESVIRLSKPSEDSQGKTADERHFAKLNSELCIEYENLEKRYNDGAITYKKYLEEKSVLALKSAKLSTQEIDIRIDAKLRTGEMIAAIGK